MRSPLHPFEHRLLRILRESGQVRGVRSVLVAVSGGADSTALLCALAALAPRLDLRLAAAHLNHGLRGRESDGDETSVRRLCRRLRIPLTTLRADVKGAARDSGLSIEMAARQIRYLFLVRTARVAGIDAIATAHTADDQAETVLLKLARGAGTRGLAGIPPSSTIGRVRVIRPFLTVSRRSIIEYLRAQRRHWREDSSNRETTFLRNRVRLQVLPFLRRKLNPQMDAALTRTAAILREEDEVLDQMARRALAGMIAGTKPGTALRLGKLGRQPIAIRRRVLRSWLNRCGIPDDVVDFDLTARIMAMIGQAGSTGRVELTGDRSIVRSRGTLSLVCAPRAPEPMPPVRLPVPGTVSLPQLALRVEAKFGRGVIRDRTRGPGRTPARATLNRKRWRGRPLTIRTWQPGDRMNPFGMTGSKKLQDIFTDAKVPAASRNRIPVFECDGEIIWIPGYRIARDWAVDRPSDANLQLSVR